MDIIILSYLLGVFFITKPLDIDGILVYYIINTPLQKENGGGKMKFNDNLPIYIQIMDYIKIRIITKEFKEGDKLPSVRELSTKLKVNPNTIQRSYHELEREDLVFTQRGMGTFITEDKETINKLQITMASNLVEEFIKDMKVLGFNPEEIIDLINKEIRE